MVSKQILVHVKTFVIERETWSGKVIGVLVGSGCHNKMPESEWLKQQEFKFIAHSSVG